MAIEFKTESEAFLAVLSLVAGADSSGSLEERDFLFSKVKSVAIFGNPDKAAFSKLLGSVNDTLYTNLPNTDGEFTPGGIDSLLSAVKSKLNADLRRTVVQLAGELSAADGADQRETALVDKIRKALA
jgi:hypothetical protein